MSREQVPSGPCDASLGTVLLVCTGNQCRSPMAAAMLDRSLGGRGAWIGIASAGFITEGAPCPPEVTEVMASLGYDLTGHRSRTVNEAMIDDADLIIGMTRQHLVDLSLLAPGAWPRAFTLTELARLGELKGSRLEKEGLRSWATRIGGHRTRSAMLTLPLSEDVPDPIGRPLSAYVRTRDLLGSLCSRLVDVMAPV